ncbi:orotidine-5'-phosphate decarboxylase [uncultured Cardiobacterium sp.]|uniref:orotidine-5'-phosphate decarboxylase n=1 Tax=uncultured Cardiobacterium sp. TaxID=417619 RepID=UPI00262012A2|nr:orotidine-5'-phosphate decarboxylase [uncultured Cardiobacterium sp.]
MTRRAILVALDTNRREDALHLAARLDPACCRLKIGKELYTREGRVLVETLQQQGHDIFLDLKFHDIPHTVAAAVRVAADMGVWMANVHAGGGRKMLEAAANALTHYRTPPLLIAVTVLTSMNDADLRETGIDEPLAAHVARLTALAADSGLDGVVCSAQEAAAVKAAHGSAFLTVTPGIRPAWVAADDQSRIMTPEAAIAGGSDYLVIGRPITRATDPAAALAAIRRSITPE